MTEKDTVFKNNTKEFDFIDYIPYGYEVWPIGKNINNGYLPIAKFSDFQMIEGTLAVVKVDNAQKILKCAIQGLGTVKKIDKYLKKYPETKNRNLLEEVKETLIKLQKED